MAPSFFVRLMVLGAFALLVCGCAPRIVEAPPTPSAALQVQPEPRSSAVGRGQAVWIGNRILTAAHVLVRDYGNPALVSRFLLNGDLVQILDAVSGDLHALGRSYSQAGSDPSDWVEDWVVAEVSKSAPEPIPLHICERPVRPGDTLYAVGFPTEEKVARLETLPLTVLEFSVEGEWVERNEDATKAALERLLAVRAPMDDLRGWSGSFVGRYDARREQWCYVGLLVFGLDGDDGKRGHLVLRPPPEALRLLMEQDMNTTSDR